MSLHFTPARLTINDLVNYIGISRTAIYAMLDKDSKYGKYDPTFPRPVKHGTKNLFITKEIDRWVEQSAKELRA